MQHSSIYIDRDDPSPVELRGYFSELFAFVKSEGQMLLVNVHTQNDRNSRVSVSIVQGEPVFEIEGQTSAKGDFHGCWLPRHPSPLVFSPFGTKIVLEPTVGNRIIVRKATLLERLFA